MMPEFGSSIVTGILAGIEAISCSLPIFEIENKVAVVPESGFP